MCIFIFFQTTIFGTCTFPIYDRLRDNRCAFNPSFEHFPNLRYLFDVRRAEQILPFPKHIFYVILLRIFIYFGVTMYFASLPPEEIYDRGDIICAIAQWSMMIQAVITTERQDRASKNPDGAPRQCISIFPWNFGPTDSCYLLSEEHQTIHIRSDRKKNCMQFFFLICLLCWRSLHNTWILFYLYYGN